MMDGDPRGHHISHFALITLNQKINTQSSPDKLFHQAKKNSFDASNFKIAQDDRDAWRGLQSIFTVWVLG